MFTQTNIKLNNISRYTMLAKFLFITVIFSVYLAAVSGATDKVICYYASWGANRPGNGKFTPEDIDANLCTHINYAFLGLNDDGSLLILDETTDIANGGLAKVSALKNINPNLKVIVSLGGYAAGTATFTAVAADATKRATMAQSAIEFFQTYNYDGLDVDWEYPLEGDRETYITLLTELKQAFEPHGYLLTVAVAAIPTDAAYDVPAMSNVLDVINVMTYDFHSSWSGVTAEHSPLYASSLEGEWQRDNLNCNSSITHWILSGADPQKLAIGIAFYGHAFLLSDASNHDMGAASTGPAAAGEFTQNMGTLGYNEICEFHQDATVVWDDVQKVPYLYKDTLWVGFDNPESVGLKTQYAKDNNLAGVMIWSIETDDLHALCGSKNALLQAVNDNIK